MKRSFENIVFLDPKHGKDATTRMTLTDPASELEIPDALTMGVEKELFLYRNGEPYDATEVIAALNLASAGLSDSELLVNCAEIRMGGPATTALRDLYRDVVRAHHLLVAEARNHGAIVVPDSVPPIGPEPRPNFEHPFIRKILESRYGYGGAFLFAAGSTQVHVGVEDGGLAVFVHNAYRNLIPLFAGIVANGPFYAGRFTGMASIRRGLRGTLTNSGYPDPIVGSFEEDLLDSHAAYEAGVSSNMRGRWNTSFYRGEYGTYEFADCDIGTVVDTVMLAELFRMLVRTLHFHYTRGEPLPWFAQLQPAHLRECANQVDRFGTRAELWIGQKRHPFADVFRAMTDWLGSHAAPDASEPGFNLADAVEYRLRHGSLGEEKLRAVARRICNGCDLNPDAYPGLTATGQFRCHGQCNESAAAWRDKVRAAVTETTNEFAVRFRDDIEARHRALEASSEREATTEMVATA